MRLTRLALSALAIVLLALGFAACGGSGPPRGSTAEASNPAATTAPSATSTTAATTGSAVGGSGAGAAGFRVAHGENSIPDFGSEAPAAERERAAVALAAYLKARAGGEWARACVYLARSTRKRLEGYAGAAKGGSGGCGMLLGALSTGAAVDRADPLTGGGRVVALRVQGESAFALFYGANGSKYVMPMASERGQWKVGQVAPLAYPLSASGGVP